MKKSAKNPTNPNTERMRKQGIATIEANLVRIDAVELGEAPPRADATPNGATVASAGTPRPKDNTGGKAKTRGKEAPAKPKKADDNKVPLSRILKDAKAKRERKVSGLDLAAKVLAASKEPLNAKAIAEKAIAAGWKTNGKTPHATLYSAMIREIADGGKDSRFKKTDRGLFTATGK